MFDDMLTELGALDADAKPAEAVKALKNAADDLADVGTPKDMPDNARDGYELILGERKRRCAGRALDAEAGASEVPQ